ncbi:MAG: 50S ribosomal protein L18 [Syntrophobacterales bacterium]|nr:50S ribosomal protein L18 [Syntrophobacterales bacterium]
MSSKRITKVRARRAKRVRSKVHGTMERPRLSVFRSDRHIYVQAIADDTGRTLAHASTVSKDFDKGILTDKKILVAKEVGKMVSAKLLAMGISQAVFDRGMYLYHGRVKALAEGAREAGLQF